MNSALITAWSREFFGPVVAPRLTADAVIELALRYCDLAVSRGLLAIRSNVDIRDDRLLAVDPLLDVKRAPDRPLHQLFHRTVTTNRQPPGKTWNAALDDCRFAH
jgi:hypothetical protein